MCAVRHAHQGVAPCTPPQRSHTADPIRTTMRAAAPLPRPNPSSTTHATLSAHCFAKPLPSILRLGWSLPAVPVGAVGAAAAALLYAARWRGSEHGAAHLPAGHRAKPATLKPRCGECGQGDPTHWRNRFHPPLRLQPERACAGVRTTAHRPGAWPAVVGGL